MHRIITSPLRRHHPGPVEIRLDGDIVSIIAGGKCISRTGGAIGTWPTPVVVDDASMLCHGREVVRIALTYTDGVLDVQVAEMVPEPRYRRPPGFRFDTPYPTRKERLQPLAPSDPRYLGTYSPPRPYQLALPF